MFNHLFHLHRNKTQVLGEDIRMTIVCKIYGSRLMFGIIVFW